MESEEFLGLFREFLEWDRFVLGRPGGFEGDFGVVVGLVQFALECCGVFGVIYGGPGKREFDLGGS